MPTPQEILQGFMELKAYDKMYVLNTLAQEEKDPIVLERDKHIRRNAMADAIANGKLPLLQTDSNNNVPKPENTDGVKTPMAIDPETKQLLDAMAAQIGTLSGALQQSQQASMQVQLDFARQQLLTDVPEHVRSLVKGNSIEELKASADAVKGVYGTLENHFKTKFAPVEAPPAEQAAAAAATPADANAQMLANLQALLSQNPSAFNALMTQAVSGQQALAGQQPGAATAPQAGTAGTLSAATQLPGGGQQTPGMAPLNPLAPPSPDPLIPNPAAGSSGSGQQLGISDVSSPQFTDKYFGDPEFRKRVDDEQRSRLGSQPLFVAQN